MRVPAFIQTVDRARREIRVRIPGQTDGTTVYPLAEIEYPVGDRSIDTEIRLVPGASIWIDYINNDPRYPIITGFRTPHVGNVVGWRRWSMDNFESTADNQYLVHAGTKIQLNVGETEIIIEDGKVTINAETYEVNSTTGTFNIVNSLFTGTVTIQGLLSFLAGIVGEGDAGSGGVADITGTVRVTGGDVVIDGLHSKTHTHREQGDGNLVSAPQNP